MVRITLDERIVGWITGIVLAFSALGLYATEVSNRKEAERATVREEITQSGLDLQTGDYNGNPTPDKYFIVDGQKIPVEIDGVPVANYFK